MTTPAEIADLLRNTSFLEGFTDAHLWKLARHVTPRALSADEVIFAEGEPRQRFAVLVSGAVAIEKSSEGRSTRLVTLGPGEAVGEGLLLDDSNHGTTARVIMPGQCVLMTRTQLDDITREAPQLYAALVARAARAISERLRRADATLVGRGRTLGFGANRTRTEHDLLGEREVPYEALYGVQTLRALENFPITGIPLREFPVLIEALAAVKEAAAMTNHELGLLDKGHADVIIRAAREIRAGRHHEHFLVDMIQGGAGTSTNMNANEVIANRALELLEHPRGAYDQVGPNDHVNLSQSTNDVYPTAVRIALHKSLGLFRSELSRLANAFHDKGVEFAPLIKMGRTQMQDAVPMTLGQEFMAFANTLREDVERLAEAQLLIREINLGATAIGTGINAPPGYADLVARKLAEVSEVAVVTAPDLVEATSDTGAFVQLSGIMKRTATKLSKICNDLRLLSSGPRAGFGEINLPAMQPGSSIMPGKVNPVIPEVMNQVCFDVIGGDVTVTMAAEAGQLQLNAFEPVIAYRLLRGLDMLRNACAVLRERCITGITANPDRMRYFVEHSIGIVTALVPVIGYEAASDVARTALASGRGVFDIVLERQLLTREQLDDILNPAAMTAPRNVTQEFSTVSAPST
jgi:aspartate ammonia-lyase